MIQFEKVAERWTGWGFSRQPDYGFADCEHSVMWAGRKADAPNGCYGGEADIASTRRLNAPNSSSCLEPVPAT